MKVVVCINHVPDTETKIKVAPDNLAIDKTGVNFMLSPYDEIAVEEALRIRDKFKGEVVAITLGNDTHKETLRKALAMGVDKVVLLKDDAARDSFAVAVGLAEEIKPRRRMLYSSENNPSIMIVHRLGLLLQNCLACHQWRWSLSWRLRMAKWCASARLKEGMRLLRRNCPQCFLHRRD